MGSNIINPTFDVISSYFEPRPARRTLSDTQAQAFDRNPEGDEALHQVEAEYRSLFENAVCGIYRDRLDGTPVRANRALCTFNGYESEDEHIAAVRRGGGSWYVDPDRARYFHFLMETQGYVRDLVSEVYRHRTRERAWITENAWYVHDAQGRPVYIEGTIQDATDRVEAMAEIERQANTDPLTGASSRFFFMRALHDAMSQDKPQLALFTIDLDRFKEVNDLLGHSAGDLVLRTVVRRLERLSGGSANVVARLGGDEFALLIFNCNDEETVCATGRAIVESLRQPVEIEGHPMVVGASVGVALSPQHTLSAKELLGFADLSLYEVKQGGRNDFRIFTPAMRAQHQQRKELEHELNEAIASDALELYYQPIVRSDTARITGLEALMRWRHPKRGFLPPGEFIPFAEEAGLMTALGNWAIRRACMQAALLPPDISVSVNISPSQLRSVSVLDTMRESLRKSGLDPRRLMLELTESAILGSEAIASRIIEDLLSLGVGLALDDFGTGYSSLSYLQRYAFSEIKIDRSFVAGIATKPVNLAIIRGVLGIARDMNIDVVAEGIEDQAQAATLRREGCGYLQGYLFGKPRPFIEVCADIAAQRLRFAQPALQQAEPALAAV